MTGYTKLFSSIITSTIWREKNETRILWITMLAMKDRDGVIESSLPGLADMARLSIEDTLDSLKILQAPDEYSGTQDHEGRRIEQIANNKWFVLNHEKWRQKMNADERREYNRVKQQESRQRRVNNGQQKSAPSAHTDTDTDTKKRRGPNGSAPPVDDLQWLNQMREDPAYRGIDVAREHGKMGNWCRVNKKQPTRKRFVNWLNRIERPMSVQFKPASKTVKFARPEAPDWTPEQIAANKSAFEEMTAKLNGKITVV